MVRSPRSARTAPAAPAHGNTPPATRLSRRRAVRSLPRGRSLRLEPLEDRRLLSAADPVGDGLPGSLREAILLANATPGADKITLEPGTYTLSIAGAGEDLAATGDLDITDDLTITGAGADVTTIDASALGDRVFHVTAGVHAVLENLTIRGGTAETGVTGAITDYSGGGVLNDGHLELTGSTVSGNSAYSLGGGVYTRSGIINAIGTSFMDNVAGSAGGAVYSDSGLVTISGSTFADNSAGTRGGAIATNDLTQASLTIEDSTFTWNTVETSGGGAISILGNTRIARSAFDHNSARSGGAIEHYGDLELLESTVVDNSTIVDGGGGSGGGLSLALGVVSIVETTIARNLANGDGGGIHSRATLTLADSSITDNAVNGAGGGINNDGTLTVLRSTVANNSAAFDGGGILCGWQGTATITNSTVSGNVADGIGGGIANASGTFELTHSTVTGNSAGDRGGGVYMPVTFGHNIIAGNAAPIAPDVYATYTGSSSQGYNLVGINTHDFALGPGDQSGTLDTPLDPQLGPLQHNAGPTYTHALLPGSPAVDAGDNTDAPATDQRGNGFPRVVDGDGDGVATVDIGAFELQVVPNRPPLAGDDAYATDEDTPLAITAPGVLANDNDADGDPLTVSLMDGPAHGTLDLAPDGSFTYTPEANFSGTDSFTYTASDGELESDPATVWITVHDTDGLYPLHVDPADYAGDYVIVGASWGPWGSGPRDFELAPGIYELHLGMDPRDGNAFGFTVDASGNVTSSNPGAATVIDSTMTFNTVTVHVDPAAFTAQYAVEFFTRRDTGPLDVVLVENLDNYVIVLGNTDGFTFDIDAAGLVTVDDPVAAQAFGSTIVFNTVQVRVDPADYTGKYHFAYGERNNVGVKEFAVVPNVSGYVIAPSTTGGFPFSVDALGNVTSGNPDAAVGSGNTLTFRTTTVHVDTGDYPGRYHFPDGQRNVYGPEDFILVPNLTHYVVSPGGSYGFSFSLDAAGQVTSDNPEAAEASGNTLTFHATTVHVDPGDYPGRYHLPDGQRDIYGTKDFLLVPNLAGYIISPGGSGGFTFSLDAAGQVTSDNLLAAEASGNTLTFHATTVRVDPGDYTGRYHFPTGERNNVGPKDFILVPNVADYKINPALTDGFTFDVGPAGEVTSDNAAAAEGSGNTLLFHTAVIGVRSDTYPGLFDLSHFDTGLATGQRKYVVVPNLDNYILWLRYVADLPFAVDATGTPQPGQLDVSLDGQVHTFYLFVDPDNLAPVAEPEAYTIDEGTALTVSEPGVLANDADPDGDTLTTRLVSGAGHGTVVLHPNGILQYTPDPGFYGTDTFTYSANDGAYLSEPATVTITVLPTNQPPDAVDDSAVTAEDRPVTVDVLANDTDPDPGDVLAITGVSGSSNGATAIDDAGTPLDPADDRIVYTPDAGFVGTDSFTYTISDAEGASDTATVAVTVHNLVDLSGRVFDDRAGDGLFDPGDGDTGIEGVTVELFDQDSGLLVADQTTGPGGIYTFDANLDAGTYFIRQTQPEGYLDGKETAGEIGGSVDNLQDSQEIRDIAVGTPGSTPDAGGYNFADLLPASLQGLVWEDFDNDGQVDLGELAIDGATITLSGTDDRGAAVSLTQTTDSQGIFEFVDLRPGTYTVAETQPTSLAGVPTVFIDGQDELGEVIEHGPPTPAVVLGEDGVVDPLQDDTFSNVVLVAGSRGVNYNFGERIDGGALPEGVATANVGFWQNQSGQELLESLNGGPQSTLLAAWLAETFPNMYGSLAGTDNAAMGDLYQKLFKRNGKTSPGGPPKLDAQVLAVAMATYVTKDSLAGEDYLTGSFDPALIDTVESYGFQTSAGGVGSTYFNVGDSGEAFDGYNDYDDARVIDLLMATDRMSLDGLLYDDADGDGSGDGQIDAFEKLLRILANDVYSEINEQGGI